jgi:hypothetical protein
MMDNYCFPPGFFADEMYNFDDPLVTDKSLDTYNAPEKLEKMISYLAEEEQYYRGSHMLVPFGCDFSFQNARLNFEQMDLAIDYLNQVNDQNIVFLYSTPQQFVDALNKENITWAVKYGDMMPYGDSDKNYWTGYFTSRQLAKQQIREGSQFLLAFNQIYGIQTLNQNNDDQTLALFAGASHALMDAMGVYQHHDAVTGTAKQAVADNYFMHLDKAIKTTFHAYSMQLISDFQNLVGLNIDYSPPVYAHKDPMVTLNELRDQLKSTEDIVAYLHNP